MDDRTSSLIVRLWRHPRRRGALFAAVAVAVFVVGGFGMYQFIALLWRLFT